MASDIARLERMKNLVDSFVVIKRKNRGWTTLGPLTTLPLQEGPGLAIGTTTRCTLAHLALPLEQAFRSILPLQPPTRDGRSLG